MAYKINIAIPKQGFEYIVPRIMEILKDELDHQYYLTDDEELNNITITGERSDPWNHTALNAINVSLADGPYSNKHMAVVDGEYIYNIDFFGKAKTDDDERADSKSARIVQKIYGKVLAILHNPVYRCLGFAPGFIQHVMIQRIQVAEGDKNDALSTYMARATFKVKLSEITSVKEPVVVAEYATTVHIDVSDEGYYWVVENYQ